MNECQLKCPIYYIIIQPIGWNFATSGANNLHVFNNRIEALSDSTARLSAISFVWAGTDFVPPVLPFQYVRIATTSQRSTYCNNRRILYRDGEFTVRLLERFLLI